MKNDLSRKIIHVDMDAFFAAVEIRDNPELKGKPIIVGGKPNSRGVVSTCSYEARKYGIHSAMPSATAAKLCPHAIFIHSNFGAYREASEQVREIFFEYTDLVEPVSIDEAYLDVTENHKNIPSATQIAKEIRAKIFAKTKLTASAGVSYNKFLAKIGSDLNKPDGMTVIPPNKAADVLEALPIRKFHGVGKVSEQKLLKFGIRTGADLKKWSQKDLMIHFGKAGSYYYNVVRGIDNRKVEISHIRKSMGMERTYAVDIEDEADMKVKLSEYTKKMYNKMVERGFGSKTISLKLKYANFDVISRSKTITENFDSEGIAVNIVLEMFEESYQTDRKVRLLGISFSNLESDDDVIEKQMVLAFYRKYGRL